MGSEIYAGDGYLAGFQIVVYLKGKAIGIDSTVGIERGVVLISPEEGISILKISQIGELFQVFVIDTDSEEEIGINPL